MKKFLIILSFATLLLSAGCKKFIDVNKDPNYPLDVQLSLILSPVELAVSNYVAYGNLDVLSNHWTQAIALNQPVPNFGTYLTVHQDMDGDWINIYTTCLNNLHIMHDKAATLGNTNYTAIANILSAYSLGVATDAWGDIPYGEALKGESNFTPVYDSQENIYKQIQTLLDDAIADIDKNYATTPGSDDFFYGGDMAKWKKLAYTFKARYYMHLTKAPGYTAAAQADLALAALQNAMESNDDDLEFAYTGAPGQENAIYTTYLSVSTLILSSNTVDTLVARKDPRLSKLVAPSTSTGLYTGRMIGSNDIGQLEDYSRPGSFYGEATSSTHIIGYAEALFLKAEATLIKSGAEAAQPIYTAAISANMDKLGIATADANAYLATRGTITTDNALQRIMEEKKTADFLSFENYNDWRRTGFPALQKVPNASSDIPRRFLYPQVELASNPQPQQTAVISDRVWWDKQ